MCDYFILGGESSLCLVFRLSLTSNSGRYEDNLIANLPKFFGETAFLDRIAGIIPGWEIPKFRREMAACQVGLKMDFFGEVLLSLRHDNRFFLYAQKHTQFDKTATVRDRNAILKSASGFLKILYPDLELTLMDYERDRLSQPEDYAKASVIHNIIKIWSSDK